MAAAMPERNMREWYTLSHELKLASERQIESLAWRPVLRHSRRLRRLILFYHHPHMLVPDLDPDAR